MTFATSLVWHDTARRSAPQQMAIDRALVDLATRDGTTVYRLYRWAQDSVSFGANEAARRTWNRERLERLEVPCVRRPTGGRGVWHDTSDLTYAVTSPLARFGDLRVAYRDIHEQLARALARIGLAAAVAPAARRPSLAPGACFDLTVGGEVTIGGRKTIGSAQALMGASLLQHGAIARGNSTWALARFRLEMTGGVPDPSPADLPDLDQLTTAIVSEWLDDGGTPALPELVERAVSESRIHVGRFEDPDWTWRR